MEIEQLRKEFNLVLANITEHSERFTGSDHLPALEVSVMMSKINKLQEIAAILKHTIHTKEEKRRSFYKVEPTIVSETKQQVIVDESRKSEVETKSATISKSSISDKFLHTPIELLKDAFSLNDRYLFANELFKKDMTLFNETVKKIDSCKSLIEAQELLNQTKTDFNWDAENECVISFYELVGRRFLHIG